MKKAEIAERMALRAGITPAEAADRLDRVVQQILARVREGKEAPLPGLGKFRQGSGGKVVFSRERRNA
jgi:nucleoid DNA-binding protein